MLLDRAEPLCDRCARRVSPNGATFAGMTESPRDFSLSALIIDHRTVYMEHALGEARSKLAGARDQGARVSAHAAALALLGPARLVLGGSAHVASLQDAMIDAARETPLLVDSTLTLAPASDGVRAALRALADTVRLKPCKACGLPKGRAAYTASQWKKGRRKCVQCQEADPDADLFLLHDFMRAAEAERVATELARRNEVERRDCECPICLDPASARVFLHGSEHWPSPHWVPLFPA